MTDFASLYNVIDLKRNWRLKLMNNLKKRCIIPVISAVMVIAIIGLISICDVRAKNKINISVEAICSDQYITAIEIPNLNDENNARLGMPLKDGWTAKKVTGEKAKDFKYKMEKNQSLKESIEYYIYNENKEEVGWFGIIERPNGKDDSCLPSGCQYEDIRYKGPTHLGKGRIYLVGLADGTENSELNMEYFSIIPINGEMLAYNFYLRISEDDNVADILEEMKDILVTSEDIEGQVRSLFNGDKTSPENTEKIIDLLPLINWGKYAEMNSEDFSNITKWLKNLKISSKDSMENLLNATNGLDGWCTDAYCATLKGLFFNNKDIFTKAFSSLEEDQMKLVASFVQFDCEPSEVTEVVEYLIGILHSEILSLDERKAVEYYFFGSLKIDLSGTLTTEMFYGRPNYGENPETDEKEYPYILKLDKPIKSSDLEITKVQVVPISTPDTRAIHNSLNKHVKIEGSLFFSITGHHHTPILIEVDRLLESS
jgi:hypothetical protein